MLPKLRAMLRQIRMIMDQPMANRPAFFGTKSVWVITWQYSNSMVYSFSISNTFSQLLAKGLNQPTKNRRRMDVKFMKKSWAKMLDSPNVIIMASATLLPNYRRRKTKTERPASLTARFA
jgi:hypothetical protein